MKGCNKRTVIPGIILLIFSLGAVVTVLKKEMDGQPISAVLCPVKSGWFICGLASMGGFWCSEALNIGCGLQLSGYRSRFCNTFRYAITGYFFSSVTPSSSGGQPAQLFMMNRDGIHLPHATFSLLAELMIFQIVSVILGISGAIFTFFTGIFPANADYIRLFLIGFFFNITVLFLLLLIMFSASFSLFSERIITAFACFFLKDRAKADKIHAFFQEYRLTASLLKSNRIIFLKMMLTAFCQLICYHSIPFFCAKAIGLTSLSWFSCFFLQSLLFISVSAFPLPGASGAVECGFFLFFGNLLPSESTGRLLILTRIVSFVIPLIVSGSLLLVFKTAPKIKHDRHL